MDTYMNKYVSVFKNWEKRLKVFCVRQKTQGNSTMKNMKRKNKSKHKTDARTQPTTYLVLLAALCNQQPIYTISNVQKSSRATEMVGQTITISDTNFEITAPKHLSL